MFGLSSAQQVVWLHEQLWPGTATYHFTAVLDLTGRLDVPALTCALSVVLTRHDAFRSALVPDCLPPMQTTTTDVEAQLRIIHRTPSDADWTDLLREHAERPFDLTRPPLVRWLLVRLDEHHHRLVHTEHHLVHDGQSWTIVLRDLFGAYRSVVEGRPVELPSAPSYADYVRWQDEDEQRAARERAVDAWRDRLAGATFGVSIPGPSRPATWKRHVGAQHRQLLAPELVAAVTNAAREQGATPFSVLFGLFAELARRRTGDPEPVIGTAVANRPPRFAGTVGMFVNTLPIRLRCDPDAPTRAHVDRTMDALFDALTLQDAPIQDVTRAVAPPRAGLENPLFQLMFSAFDAAQPRVELPDLQVEVTGGVNLSGSRMAIDVVLVVDDRATIGPTVRAGAGAVLLWDYDTDRYDQPFIAALADEYAALLAAYVNDPDAPLGSNMTRP